MARDQDYKAYKWRLARILGQYFVGLCIVLGILAWAEQHGVSRH